MPHKSSWTQNLMSVSLFTCQRFFRGLTDMMNPWPQCVDASHIANLVLISSAGFKFPPIGRLVSSLPYQEEPQHYREGYDSVGIYVTCKPHHQLIYTTPMIWPVIKSSDVPSFQRLLPPDMRETLLQISITEVMNIVQSHIMRPIRKFSESPTYRRSPRHWIKLAHLHSQKPRPRR